MGELEIASCRTESSKGHFLQCLASTAGAVPRRAVPDFPSLAETLYWSDSLTQFRGHLEAFTVNPAPPSLLVHLVRLIEGETGCRFSFDDLTGVLSQQIPDLILPQDCRAHVTSLCRWAKSTAAGEQRCVMCKIASNRRALSHPSGYIGRCYLGLTDLVKPLHVEGRMLGVFYLGSVRIEEQLEAGELAVRAYCHRTGREVEEALKAWRAVPVIRAQELAAKREWLSWLADWVQRIIQDQCIHPEMLRRDLRAHLTRRYGLMPVAICRAMDHVRVHLEESLKAAAVAALVGCSPSHFSRLFHQSVGIPFGTYVTEQRLARARGLLKLPAMRIGEVAAASGFSDQNHFNRAFKRFGGMTPQQYRQQFP